MSTLGLNEPDITAEGVPGAGPVYFPVTALKMIVMTFATFGFYEIFWFYKQWDSERDRTHEPLWPVWRSLFAHIFAFSLFWRVRDTGHRLLVPVTYSSVALGIAFLFMTLASQLSGPVAFLSLLSFLPLLPVRSAIERINAARDPGAETNGKFSAANVVAITLALAIYGLAVLELATPEAGGTVAASP